ncbi:hypothetical protein [Cognatilysobacter bugurensis]|uniref:DUF4124 domain-containing protein n=1 Tax=Cognatilysobacter bugurensis TaxID=543356 RepID=A0A918W940_9GAMM|nr:hypothetical protein [Lysobacter bugurensis]GHA88480.1 hypothetical protein GCM10007067_28150 [Lysobacter bugurensis]
MHRTLWWTAAALVALAGPAAAQRNGDGAAKKLYCWNENGSKVCGDALPATAVDSARTEISARSGLATGRVDRALSADERAAAAARAEAERQAALAAEAQKRRELAMVESYASEAELRRAYEHRLSLSQGTLQSSRMAVTGLRQSLLSLLRRAGEAELMGKPVAKPLGDNIRTQHAELQRQQRLLTDHQREAAEVQGEFADTLARYRALKISAADAAAGGNGG